MNRFLFIAGAVSVAFLTAEIASRSLLGLGQPLLYSRDTAVEYIAKPHQEIRRFGNRVAINSYGLRSEEISPLPKAGQRRVLIFGDSVVFGGVQTDQHDIATSVLQRQLSASDQKLEVVNISAGSWGPGNWLGWAKSRGFLGATDVVLVISSRDASDNPTFAALDPIEQPTHKPPSGLYELFVRYITPDRLRYQLKAWGIPASSVQPVTSPTTTSPSPPATDHSGTVGRLSPTAELPKRVQRGLADLRAFLKAAQASSARVAVVQFWNRQEVGRGRPEFGHDEILAVVNQLHIPIVQSNQVFASCSAVPDQDLFVDTFHPYGARAQGCLAKALAKALAKVRG